MKQSFIDTYYELQQPQVQNPPKHQQGLWLLEGDEPLIKQWLLDSFRPNWKHHQQSIKRIELLSAKTWQEVITELNSLSLFDPASAIIVTGNHKPDKQSIAALSEFAERVKQAEQDGFLEIHHHLVWLTTKVDKKSLSAKWLMPFKNSGTIVDCNIYDERQRLSILQQQAELFNIELDNDAWQFLMSHTENNLLNAYQTLWRLSYLVCDNRASTTDIDTKKQLIIVNLEQLQDSIVSESKYNIYDLSDAMLIGNAEQVISILNGLKNMNEPATLVLWTIAKDMRLIQQLHSGKDAKSIGIWRNKERLYRQAVRRISTEESQNWSKLLYKCDQSIKGIVVQPIWELLTEAALAVTGIKLFK